MLRGLWAVLGAFIIAGSLYRTAPGTFLGFYPPLNSEMVGFNLGHGAVIVLGMWLVYVGVGPRKVKKP